MPQGKGTYGSQVGRPSEKKKESKAAIFAASSKNSNKQAKANEAVSAKSKKKKVKARKMTGIG